MHEFLVYISNTDSVNVAIYIVVYVYDNFCNLNEWFNNSLNKSDSFVFLMN